MTYREPDLRALRTIPITSRLNRVDDTTLASPPDTDRSLHAFLDSLPDVLAARDFRRVVEHLAAAARAEKGVVLLVGGHVVKVGLGPLVRRWIERGVVKHVALNGAAAIHDFELAAYGGTSEDVAAGLEDGSFGMAEETGKDMNAAIAAAHARDQGLGEGLAQALAERREPPLGKASILIACCAHDIPITVHPVIGAEIIHQHPTADGTAIGVTALRDFHRLAGSLPLLDQGGAVLNWGSAVVLPEVFLKALAIARNLNQGRPRDFLAADFDMIRQYRPIMNVVRRPTHAGGTGVQITGHHELVLPLLVWAVLDRLG
jgi:hypothetical protein